MPTELLRDGSLPGRWIRRWTQRPTAQQLRDIDGTWIGSAELEGRTRAVAGWLLESGLTAGDRILICGSTSAELVMTYVGALRAGLVVVPVNPAYREPEVARIVRIARPAAAVIEPRAAHAWIRAASPDPIDVWPLDRNEPISRARPTSGDPGDQIDRAATDDPALLVYTSGTTGEPKGAALSHGNLLASASAINLAWRWRPEDRLVLALPLFHVHGLAVGLNGSLCAGGSVVLRSKFDPIDVAERCTEADSSLFFGVPTMYHRLVEEDLIGRLRGLRLVVSGSAPLPAALAERIASEVGQIPLERYGMTETIMLTSNPYDGPRKPGTVGFQLPGVELRLVGDGEVQVRGPNVIRGYWDPIRLRAEPNATDFTEDGWFRTGDLGTVDERGYLTLVGRSKELIISGGYNVYPREIEEAIATHPAVHEVAVVGRPSERWGEEVTAFVVPARSVEADELIDHAAQQLAPYKVPKHVEFVTELPRNAMGKIVRATLGRASPEG